MKARDRKKENKSRDSHDFTELDHHTFMAPIRRMKKNGGGGDCGNGRKNDAVINANQVEAAVAAAAERIQLALDLSAKLMLLVVQSHLHNQKEK